MDVVIQDLYASEPEPLGFGPSLGIRAFLLRRGSGNLLIYRSAMLGGDEREIRGLGGLGRQYLNHSHEASPVTGEVTARFGAPLYVHRDDAEAAAKVAVVDKTFEERHKLGGDFEVIPAPGHTAGATVFLWETWEHRVLFTGDTVFFGKAGWRAAVLDGVSDRERYIQSLEMIRSLDFDLIVPGIARAEEPYYEFVEKAEAERRMSDIIGRLRRGEDG